MRAGGEAWGCVIGRRCQSTSPGRSSGSSAAGLRDPGARLEQPRGRAAAPGRSAGGSWCDSRHPPPARPPGWPRCRPEPRPAVPVVAIILVGREVLLDLPVGLPHPPAEALDLAAQRAPEGGEIRLHAAHAAASGTALRHGAPPEPARRCAAAGRGRRRSRSGG